MNVTQTEQAVVETAKTAAVGFGGGGLTVILGSIHLLIGIAVGLTTLAYVVWKWRVAVLDRRAKRRG